MRHSITLAAGALLCVAACSDSTGNRPAPSLTRSQEGADGFRDGALYTMTNAASGNEVLAFSRSENGSLSVAGTFATGGKGSGSTLSGAQGSLVLSRHDRFLFAVNAGSDQLSLFAIEHDGLRLLDVQPSGGHGPISVTVHRRLVYVLNGASGNVSGFMLENGSLRPIPHSSRPVSGGAAAGSAQVAFSPDGETLVVTNKATNVIDSYSVGKEGLLDGPRANPSSGTTPFGFAFDERGILVVSEAFGGAAGQGAVSTYHVRENGGLGVRSASVKDGQSAPCWIAITDDGLVFTTNTASGTISSYSLRRASALTLLESVAGSTGGGPTDLALSRGSRFLYALVPGTESIKAFEVAEDGSLHTLGTTAVPAASTSGLAAR